MQRCTLLDLVAPTHQLPLSITDCIAFGIIAFAIALQAVADQQMRDHRSSRNCMRPFTSGAWALCRHPNYLVRMYASYACFLFVCVCLCLCPSAGVVGGMREPPVCCLLCCCVERLFWSLWRTHHVVLYFLSWTFCRACVVHALCTTRVRCCSGAASHCQATLETQTLQCGSWRWDPSHCWYVVKVCWYCEPTKVVGLEGYSLLLVGVRCRACLSATPCRPWKIANESGVKGTMRTALTFLPP